MQRFGRLAHVVYVSPALFSHQFRKVFGNSICFTQLPDAPGVAPPAQELRSQS